MKNIVHLNNKTKLGIMKNRVNLNNKDYPTKSNRQKSNGRQL